MGQGQSGGLPSKQGGTGDRKGDANNKKEKKYEPAHRRPASARSSRSRREPKQPLACSWSRLPLKASFDF
jgi:hypothetical protein